MPVSTWVCALSFGRCRMSKFWLLVYLDFLKVCIPRWLYFSAQRDRARVRYLRIPVRSRPRIPAQYCGTGAAAATAPSSADIGSNDGYSR